MGWRDELIGVLIDVRDLHAVDLTNQHAGHGVGIATRRRKTAIDRQGDGRLVGRRDPDYLELIERWFTSQELLLAHRAGWHVVGA